MPPFWFQISHFCRSPAAVCTLQMLSLRALMQASPSSWPLWHLSAFGQPGLSLTRTQQPLVISCLSKHWQYKVPAEFITVSQQLEISSNFLNVGYVKDNGNEHFRWLLWSSAEPAHHSGPPILQPLAACSATAGLWLPAQSQHWSFSTGICWRAAMGQPHFVAVIIKYMWRTGVATWLGCVHFECRPPARKAILDILDTPNSAVRGKLQLWVHPAVGMRPSQRAASHSFSSHSFIYTMQNTTFIPLIWMPVFVQLWCKSH